MVKGFDVVLITDCTSQGGAVWGRSAGAYRLATELRKQGLTVQVIDWFNHIIIEQGLMLLLLKRFVGDNTLFIGFSSTFMNSALYATRNHLWSDAVRVVGDEQGFNRKFAWGTTIYGIPPGVLAKFKELIKTHWPHVPIMTGGSRVQETDPFPDVICVGYGERHILDYVRWRQGKNPFFMTRKTPAGQMIIDYDTKGDGFDFVNSEIEWVAGDCIQPGEALPIEVSRGCIFRCKFCSFPLNGKSKNDYMKNRDKLVAELTRNYEQFGTTRYIFSDDTYNDTQEKVEFVYEVSQQLPFKLEYATYIRLDLLAANRDRRQAELLRESGLKIAFFGIESLNRKAAQSIGKGMDTEKLVETLQWLRDDVWKHDVITTGGFMLGLPHDTYETMNEWLERICDPNFPLHTFNLSPIGIANKKMVQRAFYSEIENDPEKYGYILSEERLEYWDNPRFGTTFEGCNKLATKVHDYAKLTGRLCMSSHMMVSTIGLGFDYNLHRGLGIEGVMRKGLLHRTRIQFLDYLKDLVNVWPE
jgi:hypothetical protein